MIKPLSGAITLSCLLYLVCFPHTLLGADRGIVPGTARTALVIGNADYATAPLENPVNDARDMAKLLRTFDFEVIEQIDASKGKMLEAIDTFYTRLQSSQVGLFYYAGHGMQIDGGNFLVPVQVHVTSETDVECEAVHAGRILGKMESAGSRMNIVILDACRDNPFKRSFRTNKQGLASMDAPVGSIIAYATSPGSVAAEGQGRNGVYTKYLLQAMRQPGLRIEDVFKRVRRNVVQETNREQVPWESSSLMGDFYFQPGSAPVRASWLTVQSNPEDARVRIMNIKPKYHDGIELSPGRYLLEVSKAGYRTWEKWIQLGPGEQIVPVDLEGNPEVSQRPQEQSPDLDALLAQAKAKEEAKRREEELRREKRQQALEKILNQRAQIREDITRYQTLVNQYGEKYEEQAWSALEKSYPDLTRGVQPGNAKKLKAKAYLEGSEPVTGMEFVWVEGGCFELECRSSLGECDEEDHKPEKVCVDDFWMGKYEVTIDQYRKFLQGTGYTKGVEWDQDDCPLHKGGSYALAGNRCGQDGRQPMVCVNSKGAKTFAKWLSKKTGKEIRLPTLEEWEWAARSGEIRQQKKGSENKSELPRVVGMHQPNRLGLYDMDGNVWEWCRNRKHAEEDGSSEFVIRGGSRASKDLTALIVLASFGPYGDNQCGFRLCVPSK